MSEQIDLDRSPLFRVIAEGVGEAAEEIHSLVMAHVRRELAVIYGRLDRLEATKGRSPRKRRAVRRRPSLSRR